MKLKSIIFGIILGIVFGFIVSYTIGFYKVLSMGAGCCGGFGFPFYFMTGNASMGETSTTNWLFLLLDIIFWALAGIAIPLLKAILTLDKRS